MQISRVLSDSRNQLAIVWLAALTVIALGFYLSIIRFMGEEWVTRSGCLVVILGIWSSLGGIIQERVLLGRLRLRRRIAISQAKRNLRRKKVNQEQMDTEIEEIEKTFEQHTATLREKLRLSVGILEVSLLITGTFLWGFGDLVKFGG